MKTGRKPSTAVSGADELAVGLAVVCLLYSLASPFLLARFPGVSELAGGTGPQLSGGLLTLVSLLIIAVSYELHARREPVALAVPGMALLVMNLLLPGECCSVINAWAAGKLAFADVPLLNWLIFLLTPLGATLLMIAHLMNRKSLANHLLRRKNR